MIRRVFASLALIGTALGAQTPAGAPTNDYSLAANWLCRPGRADACAADLTSTVIAPNGTLTREPWKANPDAPIDCFYIYPTISRDTTPNSDMIPGPEELGVVFTQFARFASQCRPYAPMYRQVTLSALLKMMSGAPTTANRMLAYNDVRDAWNYYLEHDNNGRGVVLIGHSQGSTLLVPLIHNEIDGKPMQARFVSAFLMGVNLPVPRDRDVGGAFQNIPLCRSATQLGCVIAYASFRAESPPPANSRYGRVPDPNMTAACVNPASLAGGSGQLHSYLSNRVAGAATSGMFDLQNDWITPPQLINTPFVSLPGFLSAECVSNSAGSYLAITVHADSAGPRTKTLRGDVVVGGRVQADWGLHLLDVNEALGNLVEIVGIQGRAFAAARGK